MSTTKRILIVVTNVAEYEKVGYRTGLWLGELTHFWDEAEEAGCAMELASPSGGRIPIDPESLLLTEMGSALGWKGRLHERYQDRAFMDRLKDTASVADVNADRFDAIYLTGGHGVMFDFPSCRPLAELTARMFESGKIVSAVCHGPCGLLETRLSNGEYLVHGRKVTGFSWKEEVAAKRSHAVPYSLQDELKKRGAFYSTALLPFASHVVEDGLLVTGQNPASSRAVGKAVVRRLVGDLQAPRVPRAPRAVVADA